MRTGTYYCGALRVSLADWPSEGQGRPAKGGWAMSGLVTGEAVVLGLQPARLPSRALAVAIDLAVVLAAFVTTTAGLAVVSVSLDEAAGAALAVASFLLVMVGGPIAVETLSHGRSLGKLACGLRVVRDDGGPIRFRHALVRGAMGVVEVLGTLGVVACVSSLVSARGRRLGDVFAGTLVVRERVPAGRAAVVPPPPPWLVGRFSQLDLSTVPDELWLAVRQYLTRMRQLDPAVDRSIADRLAADLVARTGVPVPPGVPTAAFLAAVVSERQTRDVRRVRATAGHRASGHPTAYLPSGAQEGAQSGARQALADPFRPHRPVGPTGPTGPAAPVVPTALTSPVGDDSPVPERAPGTTGPGSSAATGFAPPA